MPFFRPYRCLPVLTLLTLALTGCASSAELDTVINEANMGAVYLERISDRSFQAAHPVKVSQDMIARVLTGIQVREDQGLLRNLRGQTVIVPAFSPEEVRFLSPLIAEALTRAAADQQVGFRLVQSGSGLSQRTGGGVGSSEVSDVLPLKETTRGSLYAYGRSLYVTLMEYRVRSERPDTVNMPNRRLPEPSGLMNRTVLFTPEAAKRPDSYRGKNATDSTMVIDYELLATMPAASSVTASSGPPATPPDLKTTEPAAATNEQLRSLEEQMKQKNVELEELRKELQDIRQQLATPSAGTSTPSNNAKPLSKDR